MSGWEPTDVAQQALDAAGVTYQLGDLSDGKRESQVCLRAYQQCLMQLLRAVHWGFARRQAPLTLLADSSGQTPNVGTVVPGVEFQYEYALPTDCMKIRYIPRPYPVNAPVPAGNIVPQNSGSAIMPNLNQQANVGRRFRFSRFLITNDPNYPPPPGSVLSDIQGVSPQGRVVILSNVPNAQAVYTYLCLYPSVWDALFRAAFVAYLASEIALPLHQDKKLGLEIRKDQQAITKEKILQARLANGNEQPSTSDITVDWIQARFSGSGPGGFGGGYGWGLGFDGMWGGLDDCCGTGSVPMSAVF